MDLIQSIVDGFEQRWEHFRQRGGLKSRAYFYEAMIKYYRNICSAREKGKLVAWVGAFTPIELFYAMDIVPFIPELHCVTIASQEQMAPYLETATQYGLPVELCSIHRAMTGMAINQVVPAPDLMVNSAHVCDSGFKSFGTLSEHYHCPEFVLDTPRELNPESVRYMTREFQHLIEFLEEVTGRKMDFQRLERTLTLSHQAYQVFYEIAELRKSCPTPLRARDSFRTFTVYRHLGGTEDALPYLESLREEVRARVREKKGGIPNERFRIYWAYVPINHDLSIYDWMENELGGAVVLDVFNGVYRMEADPSDPLTYLAKKAMGDLLPCTLGGPLEPTLQDNINVCRDYQVDGAIYIAHIGCKQGCGMIRPLRDTLRDELGIPTLVIDGDVIDATVISQETLRTKLESFFEMLEEQKAN
ncbi:MAG: 2-hydroxyacyl-CoA dehydratase [Candidatus Tectomicrobia bacterium]|uniref:2-hydroxyacyl-CoA dehydratase n=1 Tax=Tectimicrobiota bacterium TaxID=2528274 RepID=A0A932CP45_UNCTE|nr:2-hydroxyacyl-CoA dehydratase [Candidatus Tectomicrobia bacterium]